MDDKKELHAKIKEIGHLVEELNDCWISERLEDLSIYFHENAIGIKPGTTEKVIGREELIDSYRDFVEVSDVKDFEITDMVVDIFDTTAVVLYTFRILYRMEITNYDEEGREILVMNRHGDHWVIVWRTQAMIP